MAIRFEVRTFDGDIRNAYRQLLPEQSELIESGKLDWKFQASPGGQGVAAIAVDDASPDEILGLIGFAPSKLKAEGAYMQGFQAMDTIVHPKARGRGLFSNLGAAFYGECHKFDAKILYGFPNDNAAPGWFNTLQWSRLGTPPFLIKPLRAGYFAGRVREGLGKVFNLPLTARRGRSHRKEIVQIDSFDERVDALWAAFSTSIGCAVHRDNHFLNWRLSSHPTEKYSTQAIFEKTGEYSAFVSTTTADKHGGRIGYVMEAMALPGGQKDLHELIMNSVGTMFDDSVDAILAWAAPNAPNYAAYRRAGFVPIPERLRPIRLYFGGRAFEPSAARVMHASSDWYISYLDSDTV